MQTLNTAELKRTLLILPKLTVGLFLCALGIVTMLLSDIGLNPWGTLNAGLVNVSPLSFGQWSQIIGLAIILFTFLLKVVPGIATLLNMYLIGLFMDWILDSGLMPTPGLLPLQILMNLAGLLVFSIGVTVYLSCGLGAGPRDGLMIALIRLTGKSVTVIKTSIEITVTAAGVLLGGPLGIGTVLVALLGGRVQDWVFQRAGFDPRLEKQVNLLETFRRLTTQPEA